MERLDIAVVGAGLIGRRHVAAAKSAGIAVSAIVDPDIEAKAFASEMGAACYATLDELLTRARPDGVVLATPNRLHVTQGLACVAAEVPMLVEKPIADRAEDALRLVEVAEAAGVPVLVGHHRRHNPLIARAKSVIEAGDLGRLTMVSGTCWLAKPEPYFEAEWRRLPGAGPVLVNAIHDIDLLRHLCGEIVEVAARASHGVRGFANEDGLVATLQFENGALGTLAVSDASTAPWSWELTAGENPAYPLTGQSCYQIVGTDGALSLPDLRLWRHADGPDWMTPMSAEKIAVDASDPLITQLRHFADVIAGDAQPLVSGREGLRSLQVVEALLDAACTGQAVRLD